MRLPSVDRLVTSARDTAASFPLVLGAAVVAAAAGMTAIDLPAPDYYPWQRLLFAGALGIPLFFAIRMAAERWRWPPVRVWGARIAGLALLAALFLASSGWSEPVRIERLLQAGLTLHLLVAFVPFLGAGRPDAFWEYNKSLFLRFLTAGLYSAVLFVGLAIALAGIDNLLGVEVEGVTYGRLWMLIAFVFNTWFFLAGLRTVLTDAERPSAYPAGLKVFAQYVLIPLVTVYLIILTLYLGRILITQTWPSGWIGYLVSSVAVAGILSLLLVHPISQRTENLWVATYARWYYIALLPAILMLLLAIWKRIDQYGITERRYFLAVLALWLAGLAVFYVLTRSRNILVIPLTLCVVAAVTFGGPWSAYSVSEASQLRRLESILESNGMLEGGEARPTEREVSFDDRREVSAIVRYLIETHGTAAIEPLLGGRLAAVDTVGEGTDPSERHEAEPRARAITEHLGLAYVSRREGETGSFYYLAERRSGVIPITGYDYALRWERWPTDSFRIDGEGVRLHVGADSAAIRVLRNGRLELDLPLAPLHERLRSGTVVSPRPDVYPATALRLEGESDGLAIAVYLNTLSGRETAAGTKFWGGGGDVYVRLKDRLR